MDDTEHKFIKGKELHPETLMMSYGYRPEWSEGAVKIPIFQTSTFVFKSAEEGKAFFEFALGLGDEEASGEPGLISRAQTWVACEESCSSDTRAAVWMQRPATWNTSRR